MVNLDYKYVISPETIQNKYGSYVFTADSFVVSGVSQDCCTYVQITSDTKFITGTTVVQRSMQDILSGGTNGTSLLTGLTLQVLLTQSQIDLGYYTPFDGNINQKDDLNNFIFSSVSPYKVYIYNTSDVQNKKYLSLGTWYVDWGDGITAQTGSFAPNFIEHEYAYNITKKYTIKLTHKAPFGMTVVEKDVYIPFTNLSISNPKGTVNFYPQGGNWASIPPSYDYIFTGDSENNIDSQISSKYTSVPFTITGLTKSRLNELSSYGVIKYDVGVDIKRVSGFTVVNGVKKPVFVVVGRVEEITPSYTKYVIDGTTYFDLSGGTTLYVVQSSGLTSSMISSSAITKDEALLKIVDKPQVWSDVYVERGKNSAFEYIQRLGEVDNIGDLTKYGYGFFSVKK